MEEAAMMICAPAPPNLAEYRTSPMRNIRTASRGCEAERGVADFFSETTSRYTRLNTTNLQVPYKELGLFFNISETHHWLINNDGSTKMEWSLDPEERAAHETEARWWIPDVDVSDVLINVSLISPETWKCSLPLVI